MIDMEEVFLGRGKPPDRKYNLKQVIDKVKLPYEEKIKLSKDRIREWHSYHNGKVHVAYSGGKDSVVMLHLVRSIYKDVKAVYFDTGLEFPEMKQFVKNTENVDIIRPDKTFLDVLKDYGYPVISKDVAHKIQILREPEGRKHRRIKTLYLTGITGRKTTSKSKLSDKWHKLIHAPFKVSDMCCYVMKIYPSDKAAKIYGPPFIGVKVSDSHRRKIKYSLHGCNMYDSKRPQSMPIAIWTDQDVYRYIYDNKLSLPPMYGKITYMDHEYIAQGGYKSTGCMFCMFGIHYDKYPNRFQKMAKSHPQIHKYCMENLGIKEILEWLGYPYE